ncbi:MAG: lysophospholipid acyltransferase family protein [Polyangiales bacterium]
MKLNAARRSWRLAWRSFGVAWPTLYYPACQMLVDPRLRDVPAWTGRKQRWAAALLRALAVDVQILGALPTEAPLVVLANHRSALDIPVLLAHLGGTFVSRHDLARWPLIGAAARVGGTLFVERGHGPSAARAVVAMRQALLRGERLVVFAEGGTAAGDEVRVLKSGAFRAAAGLDVPFLPVGIVHDPDTEFVEQSFAVHGRVLATRPANPVTVALGEPRRVTADLHAARSDMRAALQALVDSARRAHLRRR